MQSDLSRDARAAIRRAEAAIEALAPSFGAWLREEVEALREACGVAVQDAFSRESRQGIFLSAHTLKGQAATFGYPQIAQLATLLCRLLDQWQSVPEFMALTPALVQAIEEVATREPEQAESPEILNLVSRLRSRTAELLDEPVTWR